MKRIVSVLLILSIVFCLAGCSMLGESKNTVGKSNNTVMTVYTALKTYLASRGKGDYRLYGVRLVTNSENVGKFTYYYADKRPDAMKYSDILIVEVNNRSGKIEKCSSPDYAEYGAAPFEIVSTAMPIDPDGFRLDSEDAVKNAANAHTDSNFVYNYIELYVQYKDGEVVYDIGHVSLVNNCIYHSVVDVMTGAVISTSVEEL